MAKITTEFVDGWPVMRPLGRREQALLNAELQGDEVLLGQAIGTLAQTVVATDRRVIIVKAGATSGRIFGGRATAFPYEQITGVDLTNRIAQGDFAILTAASVVNPYDTRRVNLLEEPNAVIFSKLDREAFTLMAENIRQLSELAR